MENTAEFLDFLTKLIYGTHLSLAFSGVTFRENKKGFSTLMILVLILQNTSYFILGKELTVNIFPFLIHIPIILFINRKLNVSFIHVIVSLLLAFQLLSLRMWCGTMIAKLFGNEQINVEFATSFISIPLSTFIAMNLAPHIAKLKDDSRFMLIVGIGPLFYYVVTYILSIYSIVSLSDMSEFLKFTDAWFVIMFVIYTVFTLKFFEYKQNFEIEKAVLLTIQNHAEAELTRLHNQHEIEQMHLHDMRHHGNYLLELLPDNIDEKVTNYIKSVLISPKHTNALLSDDKSLNLVLNFYYKQAIDKEIDFDIKIDVLEYSGITMTDLCGLISNGLENAFKACENLEKSKRIVLLKMSTKGKMLSINLRNTFSVKPEFKDDLPYTKEKNHGYGTKSMIRICKKYNGIINFSVVDDEFRFQTVLNTDEKFLNIVN